ncbi:MAG: hypothetical protein AAF351_11945 [Pseudomonadota bacterium]
MRVGSNGVTQAFSYHTIRGLVGLIALLIAGVAAILSGPTLGSISASYHFDAQDVFVGSLFIVSAFLGAYNGSPHATETHLIEFIASNNNSKASMGSQLLGDSWD